MKIKIVSAALEVTLSPPLPFKVAITHFFLPPRSYASHSSPSSHSLLYYHTLSLPQLYRPSLRLIPARRNLKSALLKFPRLGPLSPSLVRTRGNLDKFAGENAPLLRCSKFALSNDPS